MPRIPAKKILRFLKDRHVDDPVSLCVIVRDEFAIDLTLDQVRVLFAQLPDSADVITAAAPELLEALRGASVWIDAIIRRYGAAPIVDLMQNGFGGRVQMRAAIARAEGRDV